MAKKQLQDFEMQPQKAENWCWAATAVSTALKYDKHCGLTQYKLASQVLKKNCQDPVPDDCNKTYSLIGALKKVRHFNDVREVSDKDEAFETVEDQIDKDRPLGWRVKWGNAPSYHYGVLSGYNTTPDGEKTIYVQDPCYGFSEYELDTFLKNYKGCGGKWITSYLTI